MIKKLSVLCMTLFINTTAYTQKNLVKGLAKPLSSKAPSTVSVQAEKQLIRAAVRVHVTPYVSDAFVSTNEVLSLERVKHEAMHPQIDISKLVPIPPTNRYDAVNSALLRVQKSIKTYGGIPPYYNGPSSKVTTLDFYWLLLKHSKGELSAEEQIQLLYLFWHTNLSVSSVEKKLQSWQDIYPQDPKLPTLETIYYLSGVNTPPYGNALQEWALAADIYMLQKLYGTNLPEQIRKVQVLPN